MEDNELLKKKIEELEKENESLKLQLLDATKAVCNYIHLFTKKVREDMIQSAL